MNRKDLYQIIKDNDLEEEVKNVFGTDYTHVTNVGLEEFLEEKGFFDDTNENYDKEESDEFTRLLEILMKKNLIMQSEYDYIVGE